MSNITKTTDSLRGLLQRDDVRKNIQELLGSPQRAKAFQSTLIGAVKQSVALSKCEPSSIFFAAVSAATLNLPINQNLGYAYLIPYGKECQFQMGYKGLIQLAQRSGQYRTMNVSDVREGEIERINHLTGEIQFDWIEDYDERRKAKVIGYVAYFETVTGFSKTLYSSKDEVTEHGKRFSKTFNSGPWKSDFDAMAKKTVIKHLISKYGPLSIELEKAVNIDQSVIHDIEGTEITYPDNSIDSPEKVEKDTERQRIEAACDEAETAEDLDLLLEVTKDSPELNAIVVAKMNELKSQGK